MWNDSSSPSAPHASTDSSLFRAWWSTDFWTCLSFLHLLDLLLAAALLLKPASLSDFCKSIAFTSSSMVTKVSLNVGSSNVAVLRTISCSLLSYLAVKSVLILSFMSHERVFSPSFTEGQENIFHFRGSTEDKVGSFYPLNASVKLISGMDTLCQCFNTWMFQFSVW